jgi:hypothetical protein
MIKVNLEIDDVVKEYTLPESWDEVNIDQFCRIWEFDKQDMTTIEFATRIVSSFTEISEETLMEMNYTDFEKLCDILEFTKGEFKPDSNIDFVELGDDKYYLKKDFSQLTMGEVISIDTIMAEANGNIYKVMDKLLCIFLRKKKENGNLETFKPEFMERRWGFRDIKISKVFNLFSFFLTGNNILQNNTNPSLENQKKKNKSKKQVDLK